MKLISIFFQVHFETSEVMRSQKSHGNNWDIFSSCSFVVGRNFKRWDDFTAAWIFKCNSDTQWKQLEAKTTMKMVQKYKNISPHHYNTVDNSNAILAPKNVYHNWPPMHFTTIFIHFSMEFHGSWRNTDHNPVSHLSMNGSKNWRQQRAHWYWKPLKEICLGDKFFHNNGCFRLLYYGPSSEKRQVQLFCHVSRVY